MIIFTKFFAGTFFYNFIVMLINLVQKSTFPCFIEFMLYFYHFFIVCYYHLFNQRLLEHCFEKILYFSQNIYSFTQNDKNITNNPVVLQKYLIFVCYKVSGKFSFSVFKFEHSQFSNLNYLTLISLTLEKLAIIPVSHQNFDNWQAFFPISYSL